MFEKWKNAFQNHRDERFSFPLLFSLFICISFSSLYLLTLVKQRRESFESPQIESHTSQQSTWMAFFKAFHRQQSKPLQLSYSAPRALLRLLSRLVFLRFFFAETVLKRCFVSMEAWEVKDQSGGVVQLQGSSHWQNLHLTWFTMGTVESNTAIGVLLGLLGLVIVLVFIRFCKCLKKIGTPRDGGDGEPLDVNNPPKQLNIQLALHQAATQTFQPALVNPH